MIRCSSRRRASRFRLCVYLADSHSLSSVFLPCMMSDILDSRMRLSCSICAYRSAATPRAQPCGSRARVRATTTTTTHTRTFFHLLLLQVALHVLEALRRLVVDGRAHAGNLCPAQRRRRDSTPGDNVQHTARTAREPRAHRCRFCICSTSFLKRSLEAFGSAFRARYILLCTAAHGAQQDIRILQPRKRERWARSRRGGTRGTRQTRRGRCTTTQRLSARVRNQVGANAAPSLRSYRNIVKNRKRGETGTAEACSDSRAGRAGCPNTLYRPHT